MRRLRLESEEEDTTTPDEAEEAQAVILLIVIEVGATLRRRESMAAVRQNILVKCCGCVLFCFVFYNVGLRDGLLFYWLFGFLFAGTHFSFVFKTETKISKNVQKAQ